MGFFDALTDQFAQAAQQNAQTRALIEAGGLPPSALPDSYLGRLQAAFMPGSQPLQLPTVPNPAPAPGVLGALQGGNQPPVGQQPPMQPLAPPAAPVASAAPPPVMRQPVQPGADQVPNMGVQGLPSMAAMQGKPGRADLSGLFGGVEKQFNLPAGYLAGTMGIEDPSGDPNATSPTGAKGILQFTDGTAKRYGLTDRTNIVQSAYAGGQLAADNMKALTSALGRPPTAGELYLAHQQGAAGAAALLANPDVPAAQALASAYHGDVGKAAHAISVNGGDPNAPAGAFATKWVSRFGAPGNIGGQPIGGAPATQVASAPASPYGGLDRSAFGGAPASPYGGLDRSAFGGAPATQVAGSAPTSPFGGLDRTAFGGAPATPGASVPTFAQTGLGQAIASNGGNIAPPGQAGFSGPMPVATAGPAAKVQGDATAFAGQPAVAPAAAAISTATGSYGSAPLNVGGKMMTRAQAEAAPGFDHTDYDDAAAKAGLIPSADAAPVFTEGGTSPSAAPVVAAANVATSYAPGASTAPGTANAGNRLAPVQQPPAAPTASALPDNNGGFGVKGGGFSVQQIQALIRNPETRAQGLQLWQQYLTPAAPYDLSKGQKRFDGQGRLIADNPDNPQVVAAGSSIREGNGWITAPTQDTSKEPARPLTADEKAAYGLPADGAYEMSGGKVFAVPGTYSTMGTQNKIAHPGDALLGKNGELLYKNEVAQGMDQATIDSLAHRVILGDNSGMVGISRGATGPANVAAINRRIAELVTQNQGQDKPNYPEADILKNRSDMLGDQAGAKTAGTLTAKMDSFANEASQSIDLAIAASRKVPRTTWTPINNLALDVGRLHNDPNQAAFVAANGAVINTYAKAIDPTGGGTISDKEHAREVLNPAQSPEAYEAALRQLQREVNIAHNSARNARAAERKGTASDTIPETGASTAPGATSVGVSEIFSPADAAKAVPVATPADAAKLPPGTVISMPDGRLGKVPKPVEAP